MTEQTGTSELATCICGKQPTVKSDTSYSGGGRYKGKTRCDSWKIQCECYRSEVAYPYGGTEEDSEEAKARVIRDWNTRVAEDQDYKSSSDKLLWKLDHSDKLIHRALARIIRAVEEPDE